MNHSFSEIQSVCLTALSEHCVHKKLDLPTLVTFASLIFFSSFGVEHQRASRMCAVYLITLKDLKYSSSNSLFKALWRYSELPVRARFFDCGYLKLKAEHIYKGKLTLIITKMIHI